MNCLAPRHWVADPSVRPGTLTIREMTPAEYVESLRIATASAHERVERLKCDLESAAEEAALLDDEYTAAVIEAGL